MSRATYLHRHDAMQITRDDSHDDNKERSLAVDTERRNEIMPETQRLLLLYKEGYRDVKGYRRTFGSMTKC